jgi:hypothetical protein
MKRFLKILILTCLPMSAAAQDATDIEAEFGTAFETYFPDGAGNSMEVLTSGLAIVPHLAGVWAPAHLLFPEGNFTEDRLADSCERAVSLRIDPTGRFGFTLTRLRSGEPTDIVTTYSFVGGSTFSRTTDLEGLFRELFPNLDLDTLGPSVWMSAIASPMNHGHAQVRMQGEDIIVIDSVGGTPFILARCP